LLKFQFFSQDTHNSQTQIQVAMEGRVDGEDSTMDHDDLRNSSSSNRYGTAAFPRDALIIDEILRQMGVVEYNPRVIAQLLEFMHRNVLEVLQDSLDYRDHSGRKDLDIEDVKVAINTRDAMNLVDPPPREVLQGIARQCNSQPLPMIMERFGVRIPEEKYCLTNANYVVEPRPATLDSSSSASK
jgi:transcription initiation factor TFIID subunit 9B